MANSTTAVMAIRPLIKVSLPQYLYQYSESTSMPGIGSSSKSRIIDYQYTVHTHCVVCRALRCTH
jgi:hypothetical protein